MTPRRNTWSAWVRRALRSASSLVLAAFLPGCSCSEEASGAPGAALPPEAPRAEPVASPITEPPAAETTASPAGSAGPEAVSFGDVFALEADTSGDGAVRMFLYVEEQDPIPAPDAAPLGYAMVHRGYWEIRPVSEGPSPIATVSVVGEDGVCDARVVRARTVHASMAVEAYEDEDGDGLLETSFRALEIEGCDGGYGVVGAEVRARPLRRDAAPPASEARVRQIERLDAAYADDSYRPDGDPVRAIEIPERQLAVVFGHRSWLVHEDVVVTERNGGDPDVLIEAGERTLFIVSSPSEGWISPLEHFHPPRPDGTPPFFCTVADPSGTPLNVRAERGGRARVIGTLPNGARVDARAMDGAWWQVDGDIDGWVFASSLDCD